MTSNQKTTTHITRRPTCAERSPVRLATDFHICICRSPTDISAARLWVGWLPKTWTQLACRPYEILSKPKRQNSFVSRLTLGQSFGTSRADFAWAVLSFHHWRREFLWHLDDLPAQIGRILLGRVYGRRHGARHITRRPTCAGREIARPSCNRFGNLENFQQVQTRITFWFFFVQQWNNPCWKGYCMGFPNLLSFFWIWCI